MNLSAPTQAVFLISAVIAILAILSALGIFSIIPIANVWLAIIAWAVLTVGTVMKGL